MALKLIIGNKNYSSWSLRPWIAMKVAGIAFDEEVISLDAKDFKSRVTKISGTGKVPALADGKVQVWESLAILEYLAEKYPDARLWPPEPAPHALRRGRRVSVRQLRRRRCHVRAGGLALPHLCRRGRRCGARLYGRGDGA